MEKKQYMKPLMKQLMAVEEETLCAGSDPQTVTGTVSNDPVTTGYADSKRSTSIWDADEDVR